MEKIQQLVGGFNPFEKYYSNWIISPRFGLKIKKHFKPPTRKRRGTAPFLPTDSTPLFACRIANIKTGILVDHHGVIGLASFGRGRNVCKTTCRTELTNQRLEPGNFNITGLGGSNPSEKICASNGIISLSRGESKNWNHHLDKNHPVEKENHIPNLHFEVPTVNFAGCRLLQMGLQFKGPAPWFTVVANANFLVIPLPTTWVICKVYSGGMNIINH